MLHYNITRQYFNKNDSSLITLTNVSIQASIKLFKNYVSLPGVAGEDTVSVGVAFIVVSKDFGVVDIPAVYSVAILLLRINNSPTNAVGSGISVVVVRGSEDLIIALAFLFIFLLFHCLLVVVDIVRIRLTAVEMFTFQFN